MAKADVVSGGMSAFQASQQQSLQDFMSSFYDDVAKDVGGGKDMGVSAAQEATDMASARAAMKADADQAIQALQGKLDRLGAKEQKELKGIDDLKMQFQKVQDALSNLTGAETAADATADNKAATQTLGGGATESRGNGAEAVGGKDASGNETQSASGSGSATSPGPATAQDNESAVPSPSKP